MLGFISGERGRCGVLWTSGTMNSGHVAKRVCVHVFTSGSSKGDFVLLQLLTLVASRNTTDTSAEITWPTYDSKGSLNFILSLFSLMCL